MDIWPGKPYPLGATVRRRAAPTSPSSREVAERVELCLFDDDGSETRIDLPESDGVLLARLPARRRARAALRLPRARPVGARRGPSLQPDQAAARSLRARPIDGGVAVGRGASSATASAIPMTGRNDDDSAPLRAERSWSSTRTFDWEDDRRLDVAAARDGHLRGARQGLHDAPSRHPAASARHLRRARAPGGDRAPDARSASPRSSCCRCTSSCTTASCSSAGCATTGATTRSASSRRTTSTPARGQRRPAGARVQARWCKTLHRAGIEVILDVVYNHTAEGNHLGPTLSFKGIDNAALLPARRPTTARYYMDYTGTGQHPQHAASRTCCS